MDRYFQTLSVNLNYFSNNEIMGISRYRLNVLADLKIDIIWAKNININSALPSSTSLKAMLITEDNYKHSIRTIEDEMYTITAIIQTIS